MVKLLYQRSVRKRHRSIYSITRWINIWVHDRRSCCWWTRSFWSRSLWNWSWVNRRVATHSRSMRRFAVRYWFIYTEKTNDFSTPLTIECIGLLRIIASATSLSEYSSWIGPMAEVVLGGSAANQKSNISHSFQSLNNYFQSKESMEVLSFK